MNIGESLYIIVYVGVNPEFGHGFIFFFLDGFREPVVRALRLSRDDLSPHALLDGLRDISVRFGSSCWPLRIQIQGPKRMAGLPCSGENDLLGNFGDGHNLELRAN